MTLGPCIRERSRRRLEFAAHLSIGDAPGRSDCISVIFTCGKTAEGRLGFSFRRSNPRGGARGGGGTNAVASGSDVNARRSTRSSEAQRQENESMRSQSVSQRKSLRLSAFQNKAHDSAKLRLLIPTASRNHIQFQAHSLHEVKGHGTAEPKPT